MTYHVISLLNEGAYLSADAGFLVCQYKNGTTHRMPLGDVRAIIAAHPAISYSNACLARLLAQDSVVLHCDRHYKPVGWTVPLDRVIRSTVFEGQLAASPHFKADLWQALVLGKMHNQADTLTRLGLEHGLHQLIARPLASEANVARYYWSPYFKAIAAEWGKRERKGAASFENKALNYGYAVVATLVHRALLVHGLLPTLGLRHKHRYRSAPLVYDAMEPCRVIVDWLLAQWKALPQVANQPWASMSDEASDALFREWVAFLMQGLREWRLAPQRAGQAEKHTLKWLDAPDKLARGLAKAFEQGDVSAVWLPCLTETYHHAEGQGFSDDDDEPIDD
jgi:CRISPR-associated protein Cas1